MRSSLKSLTSAQAKTRRPESVLRGWVSICRSLCLSPSANFGIAALHLGFWPLPLAPIFGHTPSFRITRTLLRKLSHFDYHFLFPVSVPMRHF
ncbi:hypothetical protein BDV27DRAFT_138769 [Aspergillus caelatus]|uniref:Uncharacterized protein n=1 Tax=Aspergillus caelatus TaxID=61420 RepID=A0A5N6ZJU1_9EURO|nr:uncharacterized protein BDV27DRAFT_138769 [Aspergillus caelatus]KAE8357735.1 hypothetical protein BDV27DRAFT_138769 [Aspergillus caelatus]